MYSLLEQLRQHFSQALVNAFGDDYADTDPLVVPGGETGVRGLSIQYCPLFGKRIETKAERYRAANCRSSRD